MGKNPPRAYDIISMTRMVFMKDIPAAERWLDEQSAAGVELSQVKGHTFFFQEKGGEPMRHFLFFPERGSGDQWVFFEFIQEGAIQVPHGKTYFFCPQGILKVPERVYQEKKQLFEYYYAYRNYRLFRWMGLDGPVALILGIVCIAISAWALAAFWLAVGGWILWSLHVFLRDCKAAGRPASWEKPRRPGF